MKINSVFVEKYASLIAVIIRFFSQKVEVLSVGAAGGWGRGGWSWGLGATVRMKGVLRQEIRSKIDWLGCP